MISMHLFFLSETISKYLSWQESLKKLLIVKTSFMKHYKNMRVSLMWWRRKILDTDKFKCFKMRESYQLYQMIIMADTKMMVEDQQEFPRIFLKKQEMKWWENTLLNNNPQNNINTIKFNSLQIQLKSNLSLSRSTVLEV